MAGTALVGILMLWARPATGQVPAGPPKARDDAAAEGLGWKLGVQAWTFRDRTAVEAVDAAAALGLKYIEFYPGQALAPEQREAKVGPDLTPAQRTLLKERLASRGVRAMNFGVYNFTSDEADARRVFEFARDMGLETITCEPKDKAAWDVVEKLTAEFGINAACHDHPKPNQYWKPEIVLEAIRGRGSRCGVCADTGHWSRSGLNTVESLRTCAGHIICLHFKDIASGEDRPWGTGDGNARGMLRELRRQGFKGVISLEYETGAGKELEENAARCVAFFDQTARQIAEDERRK
jgi:sugar phosphate isomerase/epimerase